jgi:hypothetical protein
MGSTPKAAVELICRTAAGLHPFAAGRVERPVGTACHDRGGEGRPVEGV